MAQPSTGATWKASGLASTSETSLISRGGLVAVLARDYDGENTNISPNSDFVSPFALDGKWRNDLLAVTKDANGKFVYNPNPNQGFHLVYALDPSTGVTREQRMDVDKLEILQSIDPARVDLQKREKMVKFTAYRNAKLIDKLRNNTPLTNVLDGEPGDFEPEYADTDFVERQLLLVREDKSSGKPFRYVEPIARCVLSNIGPAKMTKKDVDAAEVTFDRLICPYFVDADGVPIIGGRWREGEGWRAAKFGLSFPPPAPFAVAVAGGLAVIKFPKPKGGTAPYTYDVTKYAGGHGGTASAATEVGSPVVVGDQVSITVSGLVDGTDYVFVVDVTDDTDPTPLEAISLESNEVTGDN